MSTFPSARLFGLIAALAAATGLAGTARAASLLPLATEEVRTLPSGTAEVVLGASYFDHLRFPAFTRDQDADPDSLLAVPQIGFRIGAGSWAEIQASYELLRLKETRPTEGSVTEFGSGDARLFTKVAVLRESNPWPGLGVRFGTKLPNANKTDRLGTDEIDFMIDALASRDFGPASVHTNLGLHLLGNPRSSGGQDDLFAYTLALVSRPLGPRSAPQVWVRLMGELTGLEGSRFGNDRTALRAGMQFHTAVVTFYGGASTGFRSGDEDWSVTGGLLFTFNPADLFRGEAPPEGQEAPAAQPTDDGWIE